MNKNGRIWIFFKDFNSINNLYKFHLFRNENEIKYNLSENFLEIYNISFFSIMELLYISEGISKYLGEDDCLIFGDCINGEKDKNNFDCSYVAFFKKNYTFGFDTVSKEQYISLESFSIRNFCKVHKLRITKNRENIMAEFNIL